jgi:hypothetical protein
VACLPPSSERAALAAAVGAPFLTPRLLDRDEIDLRSPNVFGEVRAWAQPFRVLFFESARTDDATIEALDRLRAVADVAILAEAPLGVSTRHPAVSHVVTAAPVPDDVWRDVSCAVEFHARWGGRFRHYRLSESELRAQVPVYGEALIPGGWLDLWRPLDPEETTFPYVLEEEVRRYVSPRAPAADVDAIVRGTRRFPALPRSCATGKWVELVEAVWEATRGFPRHEALDLCEGLAFSDDPYAEATSTVARWAFRRGLGRSAVLERCGQVAWCEPVLLQSQSDVEAIVEAEEHDRHA